MSDIETAKKELLEKIDKLNPVELSRLCLTVIKKILGKDPVDAIKNSFENSKKTLADLMIKNNIKIYSDNNDD